MPEEESARWRQLTRGAARAVGSRRPHQSRSPVLHGTGRPISDLKYPYTRWQRTLRRLAIRYRKPYVARHTSVSWNLMVGRNPLLVAKEHGHRPTTILSVYAARDRNADVDHELDWLPQIRTKDREHVEPSPQRMK